MNASPTQPPRSESLPLVDASPHVAPALFLTADVPGIGGALRQRPEDFLVEEIPAYDPCGSGEHIYLMVQKTNMPTLQMVQLVARHFNVKTSAVGYAGLKDKHAITRQVVSIHTPGKTATDFRELQHPKVVVLWADQHNNKLRRGHLRGNRFSIRVRNVAPTGVLAAKRVLERLETLGVPNRFGEQRFGHALNNHLVGRAIIMGDWAGAVREILLPEGDDRPEHKAQRKAVAAARYKEAIVMLPDAASTERDLLRGLIGGASEERLIRTMLPQARQFFVSSFQSAVFNAILDRRLLDARGGRAPGIDALRAGDYAFKHENGSIFAVDDAVLADPGTPARLAGLGISPTGAMWGPEVPRCTGESGDVEERCLANAGVRPEDLGAFNAGSPDQLRGERRPLRVPVKDIQYEGGSDEFGHYVRCAFELPPGAFATVVMREIMKPDALAGATPRGSREAMGEGAEAGEGARPRSMGEGPGPDDEGRSA